MLSEGLEDRGKRFKAMLQYLILREACDFECDNAVNEVGEKKAQHASESAEKILSAMESKFFDLFVEDDLVDNFLLNKDADKGNIKSKRDEFKTKIQEQISNKITVINSANKDTQIYKESLEKIVRSPKIENLIMTCSMEKEFLQSYLFSDIDDVFQLSNLDIAQDTSLHSILEILLPKSEDDELFKIEENSIAIHVKENSIAIHAHINTATSLSLGFLNLTGKIITKALGIPSESVSEGKILRIVNSLNYSEDYV